jgi:cation transport ATPase
MVESQEEPEMKGMGWRVSLSILASVGWLVFLILWLFFYAKNYAWEQNVAVFLLSILLLFGIIGLPWALWGLRFRSETEIEMWRTKGFRWRTSVSAVLILAVFIFLVYWFWYLAEPYDVYQNIAVFIVSFLIVGGILGALWAAWGIRYRHEHYHRKTQEEKKEP